MWFLQTPAIITFSLIVLSLLIYYKSMLVNSTRLLHSLVKASLIWNPFALIYAIILIYFASSFPLSYDEAYTFKHFSTKSLYTVLSSYPQPNNHVFHSLLTWICWKLLHFIPGPEIVRIPSLLASLLCFQLVQHHFLKRSTFYSGMLLVLVVVMTNYFQFSFQARGYAMNSFFAVLAYLVIRNSTAAFNVRYFAFMGLCFLGLFTNPTFLFTAVALGVFWFGLEFKLFKNNINTVILYTLCFALFTFLVYTPIMRREGVNALFGNEYVLPLERVGLLDILQYCKSLIAFTFIPYPFSFIIPLTFVFFTLKTKEYSLLLLMIAPLALMYGLHQLPPYMRILLPLTATISFITLQQLTTYFPVPKMHNTLNIALPIVACSIIFLGLYHFLHGHQRNDFNTAMYLRTINERVKNANHVYTHHVYWHLKEPIEAQKIYAKNHWIAQKGIPDSLHHNDYLISSLNLPQFECTDTFKLHKGVAYLYRGQSIK